MAPIDINNQEINSITLNGSTEIDTVTVNGQEVFSAKPAIFGSPVFQTDATQYSLNDNDVVNQLIDFSSNNNSGSGRSGTANYRENSINGNPGIDFNNSATFSTPQFLSGSSSTEVMYVLASDNSGDDNGLHVFTSSSSKTRYVYQGSEIYENFGSNSRYVDGRGTTLNISNPHIYTASFDGSTGEVYQNNTFVGSGGGSFSVPSNSYIIGTNGGDQNDTNAVIGEIIIHDRSLTSTERDNEWNRLATKWGITL